MSLDEIYRIYVKWRARPITKGAPQHDDAFCEQYGITMKDVISFVERPEYQDHLLSESINWAKSKTPELLHIVYNEVKLNKSVADLERFMHVAHEIKKKDKENKTINNFNFFADLKDEQFNNIVRREARILSEGSATASPELLPAA